MSGPGICILCLVDICASKVHSMFNPVAPYGYLLLTVYLFMADIAKKIGPPLLRAGGFDTICTAVCNRCDSSSTCRPCRLEPRD